MRRFLPFLLPILGLGAGVGAGYVLAPAALPDAAADAGSPPELEASVPPESRDFVRISNQFIVPVVEQGKIRAMVILTLNLEVDAGYVTQVRAQEPKLRDLFLQALFDHANAGGFSGNFTQAGTMRLLRQGLREAAQSVLGPIVHDVLIIDLVRQES